MYISPIYAHFYTHTTCVGYVEVGIDNLEANHAHADQVAMYLTEALKEYLDINTKDFFYNGAFFRAGEPIEVDGDNYNPRGVVYLLYKPLGLRTIVPIKVITDHEYINMLNDGSIDKYECTSRLPHIYSNKVEFIKDYYQGW